jgi:hypothetical protein
MEGARKERGGREGERERETERERGRGRGDTVSAICSKWLCCYESARAAVAGNSRRLSSVLVTGRKLPDRNVNTLRVFLFAFLAVLGPVCVLVSVALEGPRARWATMTGVGHTLGSTRLAQGRILTSTFHRCQH